MDIPLPTPYPSPGESPPAVPGAPLRVRLKGNLKRTLWRVWTPDGHGRVAKVFHAPGLQRFRDRGRARREAAALDEARRRGLPVPSLLGVEKHSGRWSLLTQFLPGTVPLDQLLGTPSSPSRASAPVGPSRRALARALGQFLAEIERSGLEHTDPHPGNVLVEAATGKLWLMDLYGARFEAPLGPGPTGAPAPHVLGMLMTAGARLRDITDTRFRAVCLRAFERARGAPTAMTRQEIESRLRTLQRAHVMSRVAVWSRESTATALLTGPRGARSVAVRSAGSGPERGWRIARLRRDRDACRAVWDSAVRATLHGIPTVRPRSLALDPPYFVEVDMPGQGDLVPGNGTHPQHAAAVAVLRALLAERGLKTTGPFEIDREGNAHLGPGAPLLPAEEPVPFPGGSHPS